MHLANVGLARAYLGQGKKAEAIAAARKMRGGAMRSLDELSDSASYALWYFAMNR